MGKRLAWNTALYFGGVVVLALISWLVLGVGDALFGWDDGDSGPLATYIPLAVGFYGLIIAALLYPVAYLPLLLVLEFAGKRLDPLDVRAIAVAAPVLGGTIAFMASTKDPELLLIIPAGVVIALCLRLPRRQHA